MKHFHDTSINHFAPGQCIGQISPNTMTLTRIHVLLLDPLTGSSVVSHLIKINTFVVFLQIISIHVDWIKHVCYIPFSGSACYESSFHTENFQ